MAQWPPPLSSCSGRKTCWVVADVVLNHGWSMAFVVERLITPAVNGTDEPPLISADPTTAETSVPC